MIGSSHSIAGEFLARCHKEGDYYIELLDKLQINPSTVLCFVANKNPLNISVLRGLSGAASGLWNRFLGGNKGKHAKVKLLIISRLLNLAVCVFALVFLYFLKKCFVSALWI